MDQTCNRAATTQKPACAMKRVVHFVSSRKEKPMLRLRLFGAIMGALVAGLSVATIAGAVSSEDLQPSARTNTFGVGSFGPGCWQTHSGPFCTPFNYTIRLLGVQQGVSPGAWGVFERRNNVTGGKLVGRVTCMTIDGNRASIGGILGPSSVQFPGEPFVIWVEDNGTLGTGTPDQISALVVLPPDDPAWASMPATFPQVCPSADSQSGYLPLTSGDITVDGS
jgi:hypothetical protein